LRRGIKLLRRQGPGKPGLHIPDVIQGLGLRSAEGLIHALRGLPDPIGLHQRVSLLPAAQIVVKDGIEPGGVFSRPRGRLRNSGGRRLLPVFVLHGAPFFSGQIAGGCVGRVPAPEDLRRLVLGNRLLPMNGLTGLNRLGSIDCGAIFLRKVRRLGVARPAAGAPYDVRPPAQKIHQPVGQKTACRQTEHQPFPMVLQKGKHSAAAFAVQRSPDLTDQQPEPAEQYRQNGIGKAVHSPAPFPKIIWSAALRWLWPDRPSRSAYRDRPHPAPASRAGRIRPPSGRKHPHKP